MITFDDIGQRGGFLMAGPHAVRPATGVKMSSKRVLRVKAIQGDDVSVLLNRNEFCDPNLLFMPIPKHRGYFWLMELEEVCLSGKSAA